MDFNDDDFREFLYGNFPDDYRSYTKQEIETSAKTSIINRHERTYGIWRSLSNEPWIRAFYGNRLPSELLSGQLSLVDFRERAYRLINQPTIYANGEMIALRMQYPTTMPNMVYSLNPCQELSRYANILEQAGYDENNLQKAIECKEKGLLFMGKLQAVGMSEENAKGIMEKAESINILEQFGTISAKLSQAQTAEEYTQQRKQLDAFLEVNAEHLYNHKEELRQLNTKLKQRHKSQKLKQQINKITNQDTPPPPPVSNNEQSLEDISLRPPFMEDLSRHNAADDYGIKSAKEDFGIYDYMNNRMDATVDEQLKGLDKNLSAQKTAWTINSKSVATTNTAASTKGAPTISGRLSSHINLPKDIPDWSSEYVMRRAETDEKWRDMMSKSLDIVDSAAMQSKDLEDFKKRIRADIEAQHNQFRARLSQLHQSNLRNRNNTLNDFTYGAMNKGRTR